MRWLPLALLLLAGVFAAVAALYAIGMLQVLAAGGSGPHYKHAAVMLILALLSLVGANFARGRAVA